MTNPDDPAFKTDMQAVVTYKRYPTPPPNPDERWICGLTKREYFAAMAMQGLMTHERFQVIVYGNAPENIKASQQMAKAAVESADALIAELNKEVK